MLIANSCVKPTSIVKFGRWNCRSIGEDGAPALCGCISSNDFDFFAAVETWHDSASDPRVIASTPSGYRCMDKARPRTKENVNSLGTNHGDICLFLLYTVGLREVSLPAYGTPRLNLLD